MNCMSCFNASPRIRTVNKLSYANCMLIPSQNTSLLKLCAANTDIFSLFGYWSGQRQLIRQVSLSATGSSTVLPNRPTLLETMVLHFVTYVGSYVFVMQQITAKNYLQVILLSNKCCCQEHLIFQEVWKWEFTEVNHYLFLVEQ